MAILKSKLGDLSRNAREMGQMKGVSELFDDEFMAQHTQFKSFGEFVDVSGVDLTGDAAQLETPEFVEFMKSKTEFSSYTEMAEAAMKARLLKGIS